MTIYLINLLLKKSGLIYIYKSSLKVRDHIILDFFYRFLFLILTLFNFFFIKSKKQKNIKCLFNEMKNQTKQDKKLAYEIKK